jgi:hypothetical protein
MENWGGPSPAPSERKIVVNFINARNRISSILHENKERVIGPFLRDEIQRCLDLMTAAHAAIIAENEAARQMLRSLKADEDAGMWS